MKYKGSCHCQAVKFEFEGEEITTGLRCNCSICKRKGAVMSEYSIDPDKMTVEAEEGALAQNEFGSCVATHYFCKSCGIYPFHQTKSVPGNYRVNLGCIDEVDVESLAVSVFDGARI